MNQNTTLSHWSEDGNLRMIDVSEKTPTYRVAKATGRIIIREETIARIKSGDTPKGDIFTIAKIAGIQAAKQTPNLIPMCHPLHITHCDIRFTVEEGFISLITTVKTWNRTGVEMEALVGTSTALLMIYDMLKPIDKTMIISDIELIEKEGGKSGHWKK
ncbi:MAG: cyclic pyranopterin monophosphate synthase MoaC [Candidatus Auribacterota bacterium]|nr:cyclic pyranopterin monophosphate synthase MoaC [Candidatus Auribacterota bacterium]